MQKFLIVYSVFSVVWAFFEQFIFNEKNFHVGAADFLKVNGSFRLVKGYHGPMAVFFLSLPILAGWIYLLYFISALWIEDMFYYVGNKIDKPDATENITGALGFVGKVPITWIAGFVYTLIVVWLTVL